MFDTHAVLIIATCAIVTVLIRFLPFLVFNGQTPKAINYLGRVLPPAVMGMLVIYCLKGISFKGIESFVPELLAVALVVIIQKIKHSTLLSIVCGTVCYMFLVQVVF